MNTKMKWIRWMLVFGFCLAVGCAKTPVQPTATSTGTERNAQQDLVDASARAVRIMRSDPEMASLNYLLQQASGVMVFPQIIRGGFFLGAQAGRGVLTARSEQGEWSSPAFYDMGGGSAGIQVGVQRASMILVFMNKRVLETAVRSGFTMGVDASFSAGSSSVDAAFQSDMVSKDIYYFSNIEGVFAGISLGGRLISPDPQATRTYYSYEENVDQVTPEAIVIQQKFDHAGAMVLKTALKTSAK